MTHRGAGHHPRTHLHSRARARSADRADVCSHAGRAQVACCAEPAAGATRGRRIQRPPGIGPAAAAAGRACRLPARWPASGGEWSGGWAGGAAAPGGGAARRTTAEWWCGSWHQRPWAAVVQCCWQWFRLTFNWTEAVSFRQHPPFI